MPTSLAAQLPPAGANALRLPGIETKPNAEESIVVAVADATKAIKKPLNDQVIVELVDEPQVSKGGIIIPDTAQNRPSKGRVIAVGAGKLGTNGKRLPMTVKVGDEVCFGKWSGTEFEIEGQKFLSIREDEILAVIAPN
jgi:chaperonin GroES